MREAVTLICTVETAGITRGKGIPEADLTPARMARGVGWLQANGMINALGRIADNPFGSVGELALVADPSTRMRLDFQDGAPAENILLGDIRHLDGTPYALCPRDFCRRALAALQDAAGVTLVAAFEHEFMLSGIESSPGAAYSLGRWRQAAAFGETLVAALRAAGLTPDTVLPEFGSGQFEATVAPSIGLRAADEAVLLREVVRAVAARDGRRATFAPILDPEGTGNGVHIHLSFRDAAGRAAMHDPADALQLSAVGRAFVAGIVRHMPALCAVTAPSPVSYVRLRPNRWAPTTAGVALQDRAAALRICLAGGADPAAGFNLEYRPADAAASPWLALGAVIQAGVNGIRQGLAVPDDARPLPATLDAALDLLERTPEATDWFGATYLDAYLRHKRAELAMVADRDDSARCALYADIY